MRTVFVLTREGNTDYTAFGVVSVHLTRVGAEAAQLFEEMKGLHNHIRVEGHEDHWHHYIVGAESTDYWELSYNITELELED